MMSYFRRAFVRVQSLVCGLVCVGLLSCFAQDGVAPTELMDQIDGLVQGIDVRGHKIGAADAWEQVLILRDRLGKCGESAISEIASRITSEKNTKIRSIFVYSLGMIPGERVDRFLLSLFCFDRSVESTAGMQLAWRTEHNGPFTFSVPEEQVGAMLRMVNERPAIGAVNVLRILGMCAKNPPEPIMRPIVARFDKEVREPSAEDAPVMGSSVSPRVYSLNSFILAFSYMPETAIPYLRERHAEALRNKDEELVKWLSMALGTCGDPGVADYLKDMSLHDPDRYMRCEAIRPYSCAAGKDSIPVLLHLLEDKTKTEYQMDWEESKYIIRGCAFDALALLVKRVTGTPVTQGEDIKRRAAEVLETSQATPIPAMAQAR